MTWPTGFAALKRGEGCEMCEQGRPEETPYGVRFLAGEVADAYLQLDDRQRGYSVVIWRGRHVAEPTELSPEEATQYWLEVLEAGRRIERRFAPLKMNYEILGNALPHLHTHVIPRYEDDPRPGNRFPHPPGGKQGDPEPSTFRADVEALSS